MGLMSNITSVLLICHVLGDFQLQTEEMANAKTKSLSVLGKHLGIHALLLGILPTLLLSWSSFSEGWLLILLVWFTHCVVDIAKFYINHWRNVRSEIIYIVDQLIHLAAIVLLSESVFNPSLSLRFVSINILKWILLFLVITKPANITFKIVFQKYQFKTKTPTIPGAGAVIGNLERVLSAIFLAMNQMTAIGFIYTAKSIARFKEIEENKGFAEYYLIGTLFSILYVVAAYYIIIAI